MSEVRDKWPDAIRIIISGYTDSEDIIAGINEAGIYQYLLKPWQPEQLLLTLRRTASRLSATRRRITGSDTLRSTDRRWLSACRRYISAAPRRVSSNCSGCQGLSRYW